LAARGRSLDVDVSIARVPDAVRGSSNREAKRLDRGHLGVRSDDPDGDVRPTAAQLLVQRRLAVVALIAGVRLNRHATRRSERRSQPSLESVSTSDAACGPLVACARFEPGVERVGAVREIAGIGCRRRGDGPTAASRLIEVEVKLELARRRGRGWVVRLDGPVGSAGELEQNLALSIEGLCGAIDPDSWGVRSAEERQLDLIVLLGLG